MKAKLTAAIVTATTLVCGASAASKDYLHFTARGGSVSIGMGTHDARTHSAEPLTLEWSSDPDATTWNLLEAGSTTVALDENTTVYFRQRDPERKRLSNESNAAGWMFTMTAGDGTPSATVEAAGNVLSLIDATCESSTVGTNGLRNLFSGCKILTTPPELPAKEVGTCAYFNMFDGCVALTRPPQLPATKLGSECYSYMFRGCTNLVSAPALPATTLATLCYSYMFLGCTSLVFAPHLPATTLVKACYYSMFSGCTKLKRISVAFASWPTGTETTDWLKGVASSGRFIKPTALSAEAGNGRIPSGWTTYSPMTTNVPVIDGLAVVAVVEGQAILPTRSANGTTDVFTFCSAESNVEIVSRPADGYALVRLSPEASSQSAAIQFDGLVVEDGVVSLSFGVRTTATLDAPDWQPATVSGAAVSPDGKTVTLSIPATAEHGFYKLAE